MDECIHEWTHAWDDGWIGGRLDGHEPLAAHKHVFHASPAEQRRAVGQHSYDYPAWFLATKHRRTPTLTLKNANRRERPRHHTLLHQSSLSNPKDGVLLLRHASEPSGLPKWACRLDRPSCRSGTWQASFAGLRCRPLSQASLQAAVAGICGRPARQLLRAVV
eukprot:352476-Chlamydomonas_euryale.AAC.13